MSEGSSLFPSSQCIELQGDHPTHSRPVVLTGCLQIQGLCFVFKNSQCSHWMWLHVMVACVAFLSSLSYLFSTCSWWGSSLRHFNTHIKLKSGVIKETSDWSGFSFSHSSYSLCSALRGVCWHHLLLTLVTTAGKGALDCSHCVLCGVSTKEKKKGLGKGRTLGDISTNIIIWMFCGSTIVDASDFKVSNSQP